MEIIPTWVLVLIVVWSILSIISSILTIYKFYLNEKVKDMKQKEFEVYEDD